VSLKKWRTGEVYSKCFKNLAEAMANCDPFSQQKGSPRAWPLPGFCEQWRPVFF